MQLLKAVGPYFALVFAAGFALGAVRVLCVVPHCRNAMQGIFPDTLPGYII